MVGYSLWGRKVSDMIERLHVLSFFLLMAESKEELKSLLMEVKEEREITDLNLSI